ncbi:MAG: PEP-utilizing enzyme [Thermoleophilia bacterium]|nr:PEP-utilizing enzyme [Thermoleophilia bacterium]
MEGKLTHLDFDAAIDFGATGVWLQDSSHCVPPWTPLFGWYWASFCDFGGCGAMEKISQPFAKALVMRLNNGGVYYGFFAATDEDEVREREAKFREVMRPYLVEGGNNWEQVFKDELLPEYQRLKKFALKEATAHELWLHVEDLFAVTRKMWYLHIFWMYATWCPYVLFERLTQQLLGIGDTDPQFLELVTGFDNKNFQIERRLWLLSKQAAELGLKNVFMESKPQDVVSTLQDSESGAAWLSHFREFIDEDGWRSQRRAEFAPTWKEEPTPAIEVIKLYLRRDGEFDLDSQREGAVQRRLAAEQDILSKVPEEQRGWFETLMKAAQQSGPYGEGHSYYCEDYCFGLTRRAFVEIGRRFAAAGAIDSSEDIFFLLPDEIRKVLFVPDRYDLRAIIRERRTDWEAACEHPNPPFMLAEGVTPDDITKNLIQMADPIFFKALMGVLPQVRPELEADLYGTTGSPGIAEGIARVVVSDSDLATIQPGDILVAATTAPSWTPVFHLIKGAVIDRGGSLAHAAIVSREFGIPLLINTLEGTQKIKSGQRIRVDADLGAVFVLDK